MKEAVGLIGMLLLSSGNMIKDADTQLRAQVAYSVPNKDSAIAVEYYKAKQNLEKLREANDTPKKK